MKPHHAAALETSTETSPTHRHTEPLTLSVTEAAGLLGISRALAYELVRTGDIPAIRLGRRIVVPRHSLLDLVGRNAVE
jgi:excisionase family DNA binding protein